MPRSLAALLLALAVTPALAADDFAGLLRPYLGKPVSVNERGQAQPEAPLQRVGVDYFCVEAKMQDTGRAVPRCYPFAAVRYVSTGERIVIGVN